MVVGHLGTFGVPLSVRHFFSKFDSEYFSLIIFLKYLFILLLIMISFIIMTLLEKKKFCRTFRAVGHLGTLQTYCRVPKCPTALNVRQILFFSKSVIMMQEIIINSKLNKYFKKIISEKYSESNLEKKMSDI